MAASSLGGLPSVEGAGDELCVFACRVLLKAKADPQAANNSGTTPALAAVLKGALQLQELFGRPSGELKGVEDIANFGLAAAGAERNAAQGMKQDTAFPVPILVLSGTRSRAAALPRSIPLRSSCNCNLVHFCWYSAHGRRGMSKSPPAEKMKKGA
jgi:hypothetical protein